MIDLKAFNRTLWLAEPRSLLRYAATLSRISLCPSAREVAAFNKERLEEARSVASRAVRAKKGKVGVIPVMGPVEQRMSGRLMKLGGTSTEEVGVALDALLSDDTVGSIVLDIDSPGGSSYGVEELSDKIYAARGKKPIHAIADSMAASAGYWIASAASSLSVTPGGDVGSVGVYALHVDESKALEAEGLKVTGVHAGKYKLEGASWEPLSAESLAHFQSEVDHTYSKFVKALARNRGVAQAKVKDDFGQGRLLNPEQAKAAGMVDHVQTLEQLLGTLMGGTDSAHRRASVEVLQKRQEQVRRRQRIGWRVEAVPA